MATAANYHKQGNLKKKKNTLEKQIQTHSVLGALSPLRENFPDARSAHARSLPCFFLASQGRPQQSSLVSGLELHQLRRIPFSMGAHTFCVSVSNPSHSVRKSISELRGCHNPIWPHLNLITFLKTLFPDKASFTNTRSLDFNILF